MNIILKICSILYGIVVAVRNFLYDSSLLRSEKFDIPIICVGNLTVGGTGKTPMVEYLVEKLKSNYNIVVLSRGYKRRTKGYVVVGQTDKYINVGDEPLQIKKKFPQIKVVVCEDRNFAIHKIQSDFKDVNLIIMDDGFQHRSVLPLVNIIMVDYTRPIMEDHLLPYGQLRDSRKTMQRADYIVVTKAPKNLSFPDRRCIAEKNCMVSYQKVFFSHVSSWEIKNVFGPVQFRNEPVIAMSGIGNPLSFMGSLKEHGLNVVAHIDFDDHHMYYKADLAMMRRYLNNHPGSVIVTTEKDAVKISSSSLVEQALRNRIFYASIKVSVDAFGGSDIVTNLKKDIENAGKESYIRG